MVLEDLALLFTRGIGSRGAAHLIEYFGSAEALFTASRSELTEGAGLRSDLAERILRCEGMAAAKKEVEYCRKHNIIALAATDREYPATLREATDRPHVLFVQGNIEALSKRALAMVGTREASPTGLHACDMLIGGLASHLDDIAIVSGLAYGIDAACHRAALNHKLSTIAVVASTLPEVTPAPHRALADDILRNGGAIVSELNSHTHHNGTYFIARNRIIAALAMGTVVVESPATGGSLATADMADSYGRVVMAVPGRLTDSSSFGSNNLIRSHKARLVLTATDIIEDMAWDLHKNRDRDNSISEDNDIASLTTEQQAVYAAFDTSAIVDWPTLIDATGLSLGELAMVVMDLELAGLIRSLPGKRYERV